MRLPLQLPSSEGRAYDVVGVGLNSVDLITLVSEFPRPNTKQRLQQFARLPGGQTASAMVACARLGWRTRYIGRFGDDELGALGRESLLREGVDIAESRTVPGVHNQFALILVDASSGDRTIMWDRPAALAIQPDELSRSAVVSGRVLLVDCHDTAAATRAAEYARAASVPTVIDVEKVRPGIETLLRQIDVIIAAEEFPAALTGHAELGRALATIQRETRAQMVCATLGHQGSLALVGDREIRTPAFDVAVVDSTGAGDVFRGGFIAAWLAAGDGAVVEDLLTYATAVAGLKCRTLGAREGIPTGVEVDAFLRESLSRRE